MCSATAAAVVMRRRKRSGGRAQPDGIGLRTKNPGTWLQVSQFVLHQVAPTRMVPRYATRH